MNRIIPAKLADQVVDRMRGMIADGTFARGSRLPTETELSEQFDVGRSTVREAVRVLSHMGEITVKHGYGTFVTTTPPVEHFERRLARARVEDLYEARGIVEVQLAALAAERRTKRDIDSMRKELRKRRKAQEQRDPHAFLLADFAFHVAVANAAKNEALIELYHSFVSVLIQAFEGTIRPEHLELETDLFHEHLCEAIEAGDAARAARLARKHLGISRSRLSS